VEHSLTYLNTCPSCKHDHASAFLTCTDHTSSQQQFAIVQCNQCGFRYTNPRPDEAHIGPYYESPEYVSHTDTSSGLLFTVYQAVKSHTLKKKAQFMNGLSAEKSILDYGAGTGDFAGTMSTAGWNTTVYEPNPAARKRIGDKYTQVKHIADLSELPDASLPVITLWHVLEHVHRLEETLAHFQRILKPNGTLVIAVPNCQSYDAAYYGKYWAAYDVPRHLYHFQPHTIESLLKGYGFTLVEMRPMWFDSFYVSLLSERCMHANGNVIQKAFSTLRAIIIGLLSNLKALNDTKRCSSVVYVLKKAS
jgi:SAM-dependent methyltransferase